MEHQMDDSEMKVFQQVQSALALVAYVEEHGLAIHPGSFLKREDDVAHKIRHDAGMEWVAAHPSAALSLAELFRMYWHAHSEEIKSIDTNDQSACSALIEKIRGIGSQVRESGS